MNKNVIARNEAIHNLQRKIAYPIYTTGTALCLVITELVLRKHGHERWLLLTRSTLRLTTLSPVSRKEGLKSKKLLAPLCDEVGERGRRAKPRRGESSHWSDKFALSFKLYPTI
jgi:hypothetical protein